MARAPKKPKATKYPKTPKQGASLDVMKRYAERCREVDRKNREKAAAYNKKVAAIKTARSMRAKISGIGRVPKMPKLNTL